MNISTLCPDTVHKYVQNRYIASQISTVRSTTIKFLKSATVPTNYSLVISSTTVVLILFLEAHALQLRPRLPPRSRLLSYRY